MINNDEQYLTLSGKFVDFSTSVEEELEIPYVSKNDDHSELLVDVTFDLETLCLDEGININEITKISLVFSDTESSAKRLYFCNSNREVVQIIDKRNGQYVIDLNYLKTHNSFDNQLSFCVRTKESLNDILIFINCEIIFDYFDSFTNEPDYKNSFFEENIKDLISYKINLFNGRIDFNRDVASIYGNKFPLKLSQIYNQYKENNLFDYWKFNYLQKIYFDNNNYYWIDEKYRTHKFSMLSNSLYYDTNHTGFLLRIYSSEYVITNDKTIFYHFNLDKELVSIESKKGSESTFLNINKLSNGYSFVDGMGRTCRLVENISSQIIKLPDHQEINLSFGNNSDTFYDLKGDSFTFSYTQINNKKFLASINVRKVMNEWAWHKLGYKDFGIENCKNADMYFNSDDTGHVFSFLINLRIWY